MRYIRRFIPSDIPLNCFGVEVNTTLTEPICIKDTKIIVIASPARRLCICLYCRDREGVPIPIIKINAITAIACFGFVSI